MVRLLSFVLFAFIFSCTIIEDSDITSQEELDDLQYSSIEIKQETGSGTSTLVARVTSERDLNFTVSGGKVTHTVYMDWPALGVNSKLKPKGGTTTTFRSYTSFLESGKPWTFYLFSSGTDSTVLELYSFRYNSSGRLANIISRVPYVAGGPATSNDTLIYKTNGELASVTRRFPANGTTAAFSDFFYYTSGSSSRLSHFIFQGTKYARDCQEQTCGGTWGGNYDVIPGATGFPSGVLNLIDFQAEYLSLEDRNHSLDQWGCNNCIRYFDTFYLHPLMILKDQLTDGEDYLFMYMVDWWKPVTTQQATNNEKVTISFNYDF